MMRLIVVSLIVIALASGCSNANHGASPSPNNNNQKVRVQQTIPPKPEINNAENENVAQRLEKLATSVPHVIDANCVVIGDTAIVGINVDGNLERARVGTIKYSVAEALREDPVGIHAIVTADMDIGNRLRELRTDINNGRPVSGFAQERADIVGRIIPQFPKDVEPLQENQDGQPAPSPQLNDDRKQLKNRSL